MVDEAHDQEGIRARSEQAIGELAQALLDSEVLENALAAAFGAREKAAEAQRAALAALNLPSAAEVERLERRLRSLSRRLEEVEDQLDALGTDVAALRSELRPAKARRRPRAAKAAD
jgi:predicted RNase H-like nuclease (RuvC/YqgF family)